MAAVLTCAQTCPRGRRKTARSRDTRRTGPKSLAEHMICAAHSRMTPSPSSRPTWTATATPRRPRRVTALRGPPHPHGVCGPHRQDAPGQRERGRTPLPRGHHRRRGHPPADRAPFKVACSGESAPPGSPPGVPGPRLATNVATEHRAGPGGAANVAAEHRAGPSPPVRTTEKKVNSGFQIQPTYPAPCSRTQDFPPPVQTSSWGATAACPGPGQQLDDHRLRQVCVGRHHCWSRTAA